MPTEDRPSIAQSAVAVSVPSSLKRQMNNLAAQRQVSPLRQTSSGSIHLIYVRPTPGLGAGALVRGRGAPNRSRILRPTREHGDLLGATFGNERTAHQNFVSGPRKSASDRGHARFALTALLMAGVGNRNGDDRPRCRPSNRRFQPRTVLPKQRPALEEPPSGTAKI